MVVVSKRGLRREREKVEGDEDSSISQHLLRGKIWGGESESKEEVAHDIYSGRRPGGCIARLAYQAATREEGDR